MQNIYDSAEKLYQDVTNERNIYRHQSLIITGSNAIGKTQLIKDVLKKSLSESPTTFYYIDPKNRIMKSRNNNAPAKKLSEMSTIEILEHRLLDGVFTVSDEFTQQNLGGAVAYDELLNNTEKYNKMYQRFFGISVEKDTIANEILPLQIVLVNGKTNLENISSSEAAKMRILMEIDYAVNCGVKAIIIDEFDAYFSEESILNFVEKLSENYSHIRFIYVIHSLSVLVSIEDIDIALISDLDREKVKENLVNFYDANNIEKIGQIEKIRNMMANIQHEDEKWWEECVALIVDEKQLNKDQMQKIKTTDRSKLKAKEKILYDFIVRNLKKNESLLT